MAEYNNGMKVSSLYIGQIKNKMSLEKHKNYKLAFGEGRVTARLPEKEGDRGKISDTLLA